MKRAAMWAAAIMIAQILSLTSSRADDGFYKGKQITFLVGYTTGTGYDTYMRLVARHIGQHIPGNPTIVPQNMPGAGSLVMMNYIYNVAARDGTIIGLSPADPLLDPLYGDASAKFDAQRFGWLGSPTRDPVSICTTWHTSRTKTLKQAIDNETLIAALGPSTTTDIYPSILNATIGTKFKILLDYPDSGSAGLAMERGEVDGVCGLSTANIKGSHPEWLDKKLLNILAVFTKSRSPDYPEVPSVYEFASNGQSRQLLLDLAFSGNSIDRPITWLTPEISRKSAWPFCGPRSMRL